MITDNEYFERFKNSIEKVWIKKLIKEFNCQNNLVNKHLKLELTTPTFSFSFSQTTWGTWESKTKTLTISHYLLKHFEWDAVVQTLKHEMAHMIVSEIWNDVDANGKHHGELFCKACKIMDVDENRCHSSFDKANYKLPEREKVVSRIHKLFCLGESNHEAEAEAAVNKAHELMTKYNISTIELPADKRVFVFRPVGKIYVKVPEYVKELARIINDYYFVKHIYMSHDYSFGNGNRDSIKRYIEFYGEPHNVDIAEYVFHFLLMEGERSWKSFQKSEAYVNRFENYDTEENIWIRSGSNYGERRKRKKSPYSKVAYIQGFYEGFSNTLSKQDEEIRKNVDPNNTLPIGTEDPLLDEKYNAYYHPHTWHTGGSSNGGGMGEGRRAGEAVRIRQGVTRSGNTGKRIGA